MCVVLGSVTEYKRNEGINYVFDLTRLSTFIYMRQEVNSNRLEILYCCESLFGSDEHLARSARHFLKAT